LHFDGLVAPEGGALGKLRALVPHELYCDRGWFVFGYQLEQEQKELIARTEPGRTNAGE
jgi:hypothetical protein